ncbi:MAG: malonyl-CoA decarboxylase [Burkholderiales bacterium]|nr:malonyl-CoA decarboxylase [Burkholderiales bacterium]
MFERFTKGSTLESAKKTAINLLSEKGEANARSIASKLINQFKLLDKADQLKFFEFLAKQFSPAPAAVLDAAKRYSEIQDDDSLIKLCKVVEPARQELLRRINRAPDGTQTIVRMRERLLDQAKTKAGLMAVDADMQHLLSSWFNPGFLELHEITWSSPALLLEKIIQHESVHAIDGWDDLRRRLQPDRRCFAFFHPQLPGEPLIFVEVALVSAISKEVGPLLDKKSAALEAKKSKAAIFYSISNCQPGLRGVSLGNFLIKRVAEKILQDIPTVKTFCTLSPVPGFNRWLDSLQNSQALDQIADKIGKAASSLELLKPSGQTWRARLDNGWTPANAAGEEKAALLRLCFVYLTQCVHHPSGDSVAKFHLANGAKLHGINWAADLSKKGISQSSAIMVNYLYELDAVEDNHGKFIQKEVVYTKSLARLE